MFISNALLVTEITDEQIWSKAEDIKMKMLDNTSITIDMFSNSILSNTTDEISEVVDRKTLELAGELFIYLQSSSKSVMKWKRFYEDFFARASPKLLTLTLSRIMKQSKSGSSDEEAAW